LKRCAPPRWSERSSLWIHTHLFRLPAE
jgi:hypothetical protein